MIPILFPADATTFATNGLGRLPECIRCEVTEERNGIYEMEMDLPITARHYSEIVEGMIVSVIHDDTKVRQPFIIYRRTAPINGTVTFYAHHVSYLMSGIILRPYTAETCAEALALMPTYSMSPNPFSFWTDKQTTASFKVETPTGIRQQLAGIRGSVLDTFGGGEYEFDNFTVKLYQNRGTDSGVQIRYGKNLLDVEKEVDVSGIAGGVVGWWKGGDPGSETVIHTAVIYADGYGPGTPVLSLDLSGEFSEAPTVADLTARVNQYISNTKPQEPVINVKVDFVALWQTPEYKDIAPLERVRLCDTVHVIYDALGVDVESKVIRTKYDVLTERYKEIELGQPKTNYTQLITAKTEDLINAVPTRSMIQAAVDHATELITGGLGGHVVMTLNAEGEPQEILIMDTDDITTAVNVIRINQAGIGFSTTGYNGPFRSAWTIDGHFVADFIDTGSLNAAIIRTGTMLADRILGGTLRLGGAGNGNGELKVYDANDNLIGTINNLGASITGDVITTKSDGNYTAKTLCGTVSSPYFTPNGTNRSIRWVDRLGTYAEVAYTGSNPQTVKSGQFYTGDTHNEWKYAPDNIVEYRIFSDTNKAIYKDYSGNGMKQYIIDDITSTSPNMAYMNFLVDSITIRNYNWDYQVYIGEYMDIKASTGSQTNSIGVGKKLTASTWQDFINIISGSYSVKADTNGIELVGKNAELIGTSSSISYNGNILAYNSSSSKRYKHDITPLSAPELSPKKLLDLPVRQFIYNDDARLQYSDMEGQLLPGLIAEEVAEIYPSAVIRDDNGIIESWDERRIIPGMLALIQEQEKKIAKQEKKIAKQEKRIQRLESTIEKLMGKVRRLESDF